MAGPSNILKIEEIIMAQEIMIRLDRKLKPSLSAVDVLSRIETRLTVKYAQKEYEVIGYYGEKFILQDTQQKDCELIVNKGKVKLLLRKMASMTNQEKERYEKLLEEVANHTTGVLEVIEWLNNHQFDYKDLIDRGFAEEI